jgi:hypothetical protein
MKYTVRNSGMSNDIIHPTGPNTKNSPFKLEQRLASCINKILKSKESVYHSMSP